MPRLLDLFCGRWGWSKAFARRGWECIGIDLSSASLDHKPGNCSFIQWDVLLLTDLKVYKPDFIVASTSCEEFSVHGMKHFHPNPKYPEMGIKLFNHTRSICEACGVPYVMENVRAAQQFVGNATAKCGSFCLWGTGVPPILPQRIFKGASQMRRDGRYKKPSGVDELMYRARDERAAILATIPQELANCVADYAERLLEQRFRTA